MAFLMSKVKKETDERETRLAKWMREKEERKRNLSMMHEKIRTNSLHSNDSRAPPPPYLPEGQTPPDGVSRKSSSASSVAYGVGRTGSKGSFSSSSDGALSPVTVPDTTEIVGGGKKRESVCANCAIM